jgi:hypothetical protein
LHLRAHVDENNLAICTSEHVISVAWREMWA